MRYATRMAAFKAMVILDHIRNMGLDQVRMQPDGSVKFVHGKLPFHMDICGGKMLAIPLLKQHNPNLIEVETPRVGSSHDGFESRGDRWNARNYQVNTTNPDGRVRRNAFGDVCPKPDVEGYSDEDYEQVQRARKDRRIALARVRNERRSDECGIARKTLNARLRYRQGK